MKYAFIKENQEVFAVTRMCEQFGVSQSAYYDWLTRPESQRSVEDQRLSEKRPTPPAAKKWRITWGVILLHNRVGADESKGR